MNESPKLYCKQFFLALALYAVVLVLSLHALSTFHLGGWRIPITLTPIFPALFMLWAIVRFIARMDELQLRIHLEALSFAFGATAILTFTYGFLQNIGFPNVNWIWIWPLMGSLWVIGGLVAKRKYQ